MRGGGSGRGGGPRADPRADRPNNKANNDRQSQQQAKKPGGLPGNKNVSGNKGGQARKPEVEETSAPSEFSAENAGSEQLAQPAAVPPMEVKMVDASADLMKNLALSSATDLDSAIPTLDQLQPKAEPDQDSKRLEEVGQAKQQPVQMENSVGGWFAPRGQPSRRGRGGLSGRVTYERLLSLTFLLIETLIEGLNSTFDLRVSWHKSIP